MFRIGKSQIPVLFFLRRKVPKETPQKGEKGEFWHPMRQLITIQLPKVPDFSPEQSIFLYLRYLAIIRSKLPNFSPGIHGKPAEKFRFSP